MNTPPEARPSLSRANRELGGWLRGEGRRALGHQSALWRAAAAGESGLLHAPTGSGKSLAALGSVLDIADAGGGRANRRATTFWLVAAAPTASVGARRTHDSDDIENEPSAQRRRVW